MLWGIHCSTMQCCLITYESQTITSFSINFISPSHLLIGNSTTYGYADMTTDISLKHFNVVLLLRVRLLIQCVTHTNNAISSAELLSSSKPLKKVQVEAFLQRECRHHHQSTGLRPHPSKLLSIDCPLPQLTWPLSGEIN